jgi:hypothetical protein
MRSKMSRMDFLREVDDNLYNLKTKFSKYLEQEDKKNIDDLKTTIRFLKAIIKKEDEKKDA